MDMKYISCVIKILASDQQKDQINLLNCCFCVCQSALHNTQLTNHAADITAIVKLAKMKHQFPQVLEWHRVKTVTAYVMQLGSCMATNICSVNVIYELVQYNIFKIQFKTSVNLMIITLNYQLKR
jgi:hypothetical protein